MLILRFCCRNALCTLVRVSEKGLWPLGVLAAARVCLSNDIITPANRGFTGIENCCQRSRADSFITFQNVNIQHDAV